MNPVTVSPKPVFDPKPLAEKPEPTAEESARALPDIIKSSREVIGKPCLPGQKLFEAPNGYVMVGEAGADRVFCRYAEKEPGVMGNWINPMRGQK